MNNALVNMLKKVVKTSAVATLVTMLTVWGALVQTAGAQNANPVPVQYFYIPQPEDHLLQVYRTIQAGGSGAVASDPIWTYVSIAILADNTVVYFDQWENGYDSDISNPTNIYSFSNPGGTQIWGDGDNSNGAPPGVPDDILKAGTVILLNNPVTSTNRLAIDFDGGDKIAASKTIAVSRLSWSTGPNTLLAGANEVFDTQNWGTNYTVPIGEDVTYHRLFNYTGLSIMAGMGGAHVEVDADGNGSYELSFDLAEGENYLINGGVRKGAKIRASNPVQVEMMTGDRGDQYETRFYRLTPDIFLSDKYYTPVSTPGSAQGKSNTNTAVFLYNPNSSSIQVNYTYRNGNNMPTSTLTVPANGYIVQLIPDGSGASFKSKNGQKFHAFSATDMNGSSNKAGENRNWDWGFTLTGEASLTSQLLVGLGIGRDPTSPTNPNENGNPVWVTPIGNGNTAVDVYVDFDADPTTGPLTDPSGNKYNVKYSLQELQQQEIYDTQDRNQTGMLVYTLDPNIKLAAAWGQDPSTASVSAPGLDAGTGIPPAPLYDAGKNAVISEDLDGDGFISPGDIIEYKIAINNISRAPVPNLRVIDNLPSEVTYIANSTYFKNYDGTVSQIPDAGSTAFPLDEGGAVVNNVTALPLGKSYEVTFKAKIKDFNQLNGVSTIINTGSVNALNMSIPLLAYTPLHGKIGDKVWEDLNRNGIQDAGEPGISGVTVNLLKSNGDVIATTTTDNNGYYQFLGVRAGDYKVEFENPGSYVYTTKNADGQGINGAVNSDANPSGVTDVFSLLGGEKNINIDAGLYRNGTIGDKVWEDTNGDGIQDAGEPGLSGVTVKLYDASNNLLGTTTTDNNGNYYFNEMPAGDYYVEFTAPNGYVFAPKDQGGDDEKDSDANPNTGKTSVFTLNNGQSNYSIDAGLVPSVPGTIGDRVWDDKDKDGIQDMGEPGLPGVTVKLYTCQGFLVGTTTTDQNGNYSFTNINPGQYFVTFEPLNGFVFSPKDQGNDDELDSDADPVTGETACFILPSGGTVTSADAGMYSSSADLAITKTVNLAAINCGSTPTYTITVTNNGPGDANGVVVNDLLPAGMVFTSATPSQGVYDPNTGNWNVGALANGASATLQIKTTVDCDELNLTVNDLGVAAPFNLFVLKNFVAPSSDVEGKAAVGGNANLSGYSVGDKLPNSNGTEDVLIVGGNLVYTSGRVYNGNVVYGGVTNLPVNSVSIEEGTLRHGSVIDFAQAATELQGLSTRLAGYQSNGTTTFEWGTLALTGDNPFLNVFTVNAADLNQAHTVDITVPNGATVLVNILGTNVNWHGGLWVRGTTINSVLYNFPEATSITLSGIDVTGTLLAPFADLNFPAGLITGQAIVKSMTGAGQFNLSPFIGNIPSNTTVVNSAAITGSDISDPNPANDIASVSSNYSPTDPGNGGGNGGGGNGGGNVSWQQVGNFPAGHIITALEADGNGTIFAATASGFIFKSNDNNTWTHINPSVKTGVVWMLKYMPDGTLFAASQTGVWKGANNGTSWTQTSLSGKDVRTIKADDDGIIYAGTWGFGVFTSNDMGANWAEANNGFDNHLIVTGITVAPGGVVFASTYDGGVFKSVDQGAHWVEASPTYKYIWTLSSTTDGVLFAGTYGDGLYKSENNGSTWTKTTFPGLFVFEMRIDNDNNIYATSYSGGVFRSTDKGSTWTNVGLGGFGLSSLLVVPNGAKGQSAGALIYSGTASGGVYMAASNVMGIEGGMNQVPTEFDLGQNYPNPFNPSTMINVAIPKAGNYSMQVFDITGQVVTTLMEGNYEPGNFKVEFNAQNIPSGIYFYRLTGDNVNLVKKMILMK